MGDEKLHYLTDVHMNVEIVLFLTVVRNVIDADAESRRLKSTIRKDMTGRCNAALQTSYQLLRCTAQQRQENEPSSSVCGAPPAMCTVF